MAALCSTILVLVTACFVGSLGVGLVRRIPKDRSLGVSDSVVVQIQSKGDAVSPELAKQRSDGSLEGAATTEAVLHSGLVEINSAGEVRNHEAERILPGAAVVSMRQVKTKTHSSVSTVTGGSRINETVEVAGGGQWWGCSNDVGASCYWDSHCCGAMKCKGVLKWRCGHTPGSEGESCNQIFYPCDEHLLCHHGQCTNYNNVLLKGTKGTCAAGSSPGKIKVMTYNLFLIQCILPGDWGGLTVACQPEAEQKVRIPKLMQWMKDRDEDVVIVQELFDLRREVIDGMASAGFCHYVSTPFGKSGSGLAIFSKHEIKTFDFIDWFDWTGSNSDTLWDPEATADKGVMYANIAKDGENYNIFNAHAQSNSLREHHDTRLGQFIKIREFAEKLQLPQTELILFGGDFNENKYKPNNQQKYYKEMLEELHAFEPEMKGNLKYSLSASNNPFLVKIRTKSLIGAKDVEKHLDYVFVSEKGKRPQKSHCEILKPQWPKDCSTAECMLSDHFPNTCTFEG